MSDVSKLSLKELRHRSEKYLNKGRIAHVHGCEEEAAALAKRWGISERTAAEAGILHDITKRLNPEEHLDLCRKYGIDNDGREMQEPKLMHAKTGAAFARDLFGISDEVYEAIRWHTTGKPAMTTLEKIIYLADYIEPTRDFEGVEKLRKLAYEDLDKAMELGLKMSIDEITARGDDPFEITRRAYEYYAGGETC